MWRLIIAGIVISITTPFTFAAAPPGSTFDGDIWACFFGSPYYKGISAGGDMYWFPVPWVGLVAYYDWYKGESGYFDSAFGGTTLAGGLELRSQTKNNLNLLLLAGRRSYQDVGSVSLFLPRLRLTAGMMYGEITGQFMPDDAYRAEAEIGPEWRRNDHSLVLRLAAIYIHDQATELVNYKYDQYGGLFRWKPDPSIEVQGRLLYNIDLSQELDSYWSSVIAVSFSPFYLINR